MSKDEVLPPSRLDMDNEIHQAISMAHRVNERMAREDPALEDIPEEEEEAGPEVEEPRTVVGGLSEPPSAWTRLRSGWRNSAWMALHWAVLVAVILLVPRMMQPVLVRVQEGWKRNLCSGGQTALVYVFLSCFLPRQ